MAYNFNSSLTPYSGYPANAVGVTPVTKDIASYSYDTQRQNIQKTYNYLTTEQKTDYTWPIVGVAVSALACLAVKFLKK